jgi:hypothetical protein
VTDLIERRCPDALQMKALAGDHEGLAIEDARRAFDLSKRRRGTEAEERRAGQQAHGEGCHLPRRIHPRSPSLAAADAAGVRPAVPTGQAPGRQDHDRQSVKARHQAPPRARRGAAALARFQQRSTSFVVDAMNGCSALHHRVKPLIPRAALSGTRRLNELITCVD